MRRKIFWLALPQGPEYLRFSCEGDLTMKRLCGALAVAGALGVSAAAFAAANESAMQDCFNKHSQMMHKPSVKNLRDCWQTHRHLMRK